MTIERREHEGEETVGNINEANAFFIWGRCLSEVRFG